MSSSLPFSSSGLGNTSAPGTNGLHNLPATTGKPFWDLDTLAIQRWIRGLAPGVHNTGGMLFPKKVAVAAANGAANAAASGARPPAMTNEEYDEKVKIGNILLDNLTKSLSCASSKDTSESPSKKKQKTDIGKSNSLGAGDIYKILDPSFAKTAENSSDLLPGAILSRMTLGGLVNALCGVEGGLVDTTTCIPLEDLKEGSVTNGDRIDSSVTAAGEAKKNEVKRIKGMEAVVETAGKLTLKQLVQMARGLHRSVAAR